MNYTQRRTMSMDERNDEVRRHLQKDRDFRRSGQLMASIRSVQVHGTTEQVNTAEDLLRRAEAKFGALKVGQKGTRK